MPIRTLFRAILQGSTCWLAGGGVSGAHRLVLFIQLEVAHKHFRLARPTKSAQGGGSSRACYFGTSGGGFGEVSGAYRLVLFIQLEVAHKHFRLARPTESAQGGGVEPGMLTNLAVQLLLFKTRTFTELELELEHGHHRA